MKKLLALLTVVFALVVNGISAGYPVLVAYLPDAEIVDGGFGQLWYFFTMPPPASPGLYDWSVSFDAGATWTVLSGSVDFTNPDNYPLVSVWVNPFLKAPYAWYRYTQVNPPAIRSRKARK